MRSAVYNSAILDSTIFDSTIPDSTTPEMKLANRAVIGPLSVSGLLFGFLLFVGFPLRAFAAPAENWNDLEQQLARKVVAITGPGAVAVTIENRSSLGKRDSDVIGNGMRAALEMLGIRFVTADRAAATVSITLSENQTSYVWVAQVHQGDNDVQAVMVSTARGETTESAHESVPLTLHRTSLWKQRERILDVATLDESNPPAHIAVLDGKHVTLYRWQGAKWQQEQSLVIVHAKPWPRDLRGRLIAARDHLFDAYLPGVVCRSVSGGSLTINCRESDDPWPLVASNSAAVATVNNFASNLPAAPPLNAFYAPSRNFFTGAISPRIGKFSTFPKVYSLAFVPREKYVLWLLAGTDGQIHMIDGVSDLVLRPASDKAPWGSDIATIHTSCGAGWQVLAVSSATDEQVGDSLRAYEFPDRDPVAVSAAVELSGEVTALWATAKGDSAIAVARSRETGEYEAFYLAISCGQ